MRRALPAARLPDVLAPPGGLSDEEARGRRARYGPNAILEAPAHPWRRIARDTVRDPMLWFLAGVSALYAAVGQHTESLTLLAAIVPLVVMDFVLHRRTQASTEGLQGRLAARATTIRGGVAVEIPAIDLVPGDLVVVRAGAPFPADGLVVAGEELQVDESALTGEAFPAAKRALDTAVLAAAAEPIEISRSDPAVPERSERWGLSRGVPAVPERSERREAWGAISGPPMSLEEVFVDGAFWVFAGTRLLTNEARVRIAFTGADTLYGEIVRSAAGGPRARTPLQRAINRLVAILVVAAAVVCVILAGARLRQGFGWLDALVSAVTLASAALPEEFPVVFTVFLGVGVYRLARRQALVRRAVCVENIGRVTCICSDKTGTITEGRLRLTDALTDDSISTQELLRLAALVARPEAGDPVDAAVAAAAQAAGVGRDEHRVLKTFPFTESRRRETAVARESDGSLIAATKGAAEVVLALATLTPAEREAWDARVAALAQAGGKVLACAWRRLEATDAPGAEPARGYRLAGLLAFADPVREGVVEATRACRDAGIHTIMVTGDHPLTARAVARAIGLGGEAPSVISGDELDAALGSGGRAQQHIDVIARATPAQKLRLVRRLQEMGEVVAVTGDGVNDVPALQAADVGIAMGERATRSAREAAAIVLLDDNFRTIVRAIGEGRQLFENLRRSFQYLLMIHIPLVIAAALIPLAGYPLLFLPLHIVWLELIIHPTALLVFQTRPGGGTIPRGRPRRDTRLFSRADWAVIAGVGALLTVLVVAAYVRSVEESGDVEHGRAGALAVLTLASALVTLALSQLRTMAGAVVALVTIVVSAALIQTPPSARLLGLAPLHVDEWALAALGALLVASVPLAADALRRRGRPR
jgi:Ca2+-transporting ATPase